MKSALLRLRERRDSMSATERAVSDYVLEHQGEAVELSVHQLAEKTFASPSTVIRMCQRVGFSGYKDFRQAVACEVAVHCLNQGKERREITWSDSLDDIVDKVTYQNIMSLENTKNLVDTRILQSCVDLLASARTVLLFGLGASLYAARDLNMKLLRLNKPCVTNDDWRSQLLQARNATERDLAIVVSDSGETAEFVRCINVLRENRTPIVAITRRDSSPVAELADYCLYTADGGSAVQPGAMSARLSQLNIIDILFTAYANSRCEDGMEHRANSGQARAVGMAGLI